MSQQRNPSEVVTTSDLDAEGEAPHSRGLTRFFLRKAPHLGWGGALRVDPRRAMRRGRAAGCLSVPTRYAHSPSEMVDYDDVKNSVKLLVALLSKPVEFYRVLR
jgi:hypothetical protein